ncbi:MAG: SRPBCC family protein [Prevotella bivia]|uniref:polyketide cyclase n=1 Tax=Prevotella bivia TaxID=28125 RepID=UPI0006605623|nr:polyketide cyclase [Prevotella bivia]MBS6329339.1 SRPBCC family protein [Prevotella bivia]MDK7762627.1 SRPBCC family protein [Prevotella bivia]MDZ3817069.1 SRPBCC family protein [Prevotella bivia]
MSKFESNVKQIAYPQQNVYNMLSDLTNIERVKAQIPDDKLKDLTFDKDTISISVSPIGQISMRIIERDEPKTIKFASENSPLVFNFWIQLLPVDDTSSKIKLTIDADIPFFAKGMVAGPLQEGVEKIADALAMIPYNV